MIGSEYSPNQLVMTLFGYLTFANLVNVLCMQWFIKDNCLRDTFYVHLNVGTFLIEATNGYLSLTFSYKHFTSN